MTASSRENRKRAVVAVSAVMLGWLLLAPSVARAANGDCSQPVSNGAAPVATDCLFILNAAVGLQTCSPECICAPSGELPISASDALACLQKSVGQPITLNCPCEPVITEGDDFNDNDRDNARWGAAYVDGNGTLDETNQRLEYTCNSGTADDGEDWEWIATALPLDSNWEIQIDTVNLTVPSGDNQVNSLGVGVYNGVDSGDEVYAEMYASSLGGPPARNGFFAEMYLDGIYVADADSGGSDVTAGAVRMLFDSSSQVIHAQYDTDPSNGYQWTPYGSFGITGSGGSNGNADWGLGDADLLYIYAYGYSARMRVEAGKMWGDNFLVTGGVPVP
jgi:hypothetical protein